jgi:23S rRNA (adenine2503-C2)-methyltransferase
MATWHHNPKNLIGRSQEDLERLAEELCQPRFRGRQLYEALYKRRTTDFAAMSNLSKAFREELARHHSIEYPAVERQFASRDLAVRYLLRLSDGLFIETVYMPDETRTTLCLSSQVGCAVDCKFCFTALLGVKRSLTAAEIVGQVLAVSAAQAIPPRARLNLVFMGMGEPLLNLAAVMKAVRILADPNGLGVPLRRITISTAGIVPKIRELGLDPMRPKLAISLNASTDAQRDALMPINRKYPLEQLMAACRDYPLRPREHLTFEYVMLDGVNDSDADARRVVRLLAGLKAKVNLIPYNGGDEIPYRSSPMRRVMAFQDILVARDIPAYIRISRGQDVRAACGQLSLAGVGDWRLHPS